MKCVIFDMDGTLLNSSRAIEIAVNNIRDELFGLPPLSRNFIVKTINDPRKNPLLQFYGKLSATRAESEYFEREFITNYHEHAVLYDGIRELLEHCKARGYFIAVASNATTSTLSGILSRQGVNEIFDLVVGTDENMPSKPDPAMLLHVLEHSPYKKAIFLGDSKKDELAAINATKILREDTRGVASMEYLHVVWGFGERSEISQNASEVMQAREIIDKF